MILMPLRKHFKNNKSGFTLLELIVVLVILGILAGIILATFLGLPETAKDSANLATARTVYATAAAAEAQTPGANYTIEELVSNGLLESDPGPDFSVAYDPLIVSYKAANGDTLNYPE